MVCCGQFNPILERALNPALRADMVAFLHRLAANDPNIVLLEPPRMPEQRESDYEDLMHVTQEARARFTPYIADALRQLDGGNAAFSTGRESLPTLNTPRREPGN
jgi:hypothetical protein